MKASDAAIAAEEGTCSRRKIGCATYDKFGNLLSIGWNGPISGQCNCPGKHIPAGAGNAECYGVHAEVRALLSCDSPERIHRIHCTKAPCTNCTMILLGTNCRVITFDVPSNEVKNRELWENAGRSWNIENLGDNQ